ncbi:MAG: hypothetical protein ACFB03_23620 [Paracoccaceae bacterium]|mgnify:CR=1 FL=1
MTDNNIDPARKAEIDRKIRAAERARRSKRAEPPKGSAIREAAVARKLERAEGKASPCAPPMSVNERKALERIERQNRLKAGGSTYREVLTRVGLGDVDNATLLLFAFTLLTMLFIPLVYVVSS